MSEKPRPAPLTFPDADRSPLSIRAKALVFFDPRSHRVREELERLAPQGQPVLIEGETGTGKEPARQADPPPQRTRRSVRRGQLQRPQSQPCRSRAVRLRSRRP